MYCDCYQSWSMYPVKDMVGGQCVCWTVKLKVSVTTGAFSVVITLIGYSIHCVALTGPVIMNTSYVVTRIHNINVRNQMVSDKTHLVFVSF